MTILALNGTFYENASSPFHLVSCLKKPFDAHPFFGSIDFEFKNVFNYYQLINKYMYLKNCIGSADVKSNAEHLNMKR